MSIKNILLSLVFILMAGCYPNAPDNLAYLTADEQAIQGEMIQMWEDHFGAVPECREQRYNVRVLFADDSQFVSHCVRCPPNLKPDGESRVTQECSWGYANACFVDPRFGNIFSRPVPMVVIHDSFNRDQRQSLLKHELVHWLEHCADGHTMNSRHDGPVWEEVFVGW